LAPWSGPAGNGLGTENEASGNTSAATIEVFGTARTGVPGSRETAFEHGGAAGNEVSGNEVSGTSSGAPLPGGIGR